jgi:hypothetical protein
MASMWSKWVASSNAAIAKKMKLGQRASVHQMDRCSRVSKVSSVIKRLCKNFAEPIGDSKSQFDRSRQQDAMGLHRNDGIRFIRASPDIIVRN